MRASWVWDLGLVDGGGVRDFDFGFGGGGGVVDWKRGGGWRRRGKNN